MPHVTFVYPSVGRFPRTRYVRSWQMQPLSIAALSGLTPPEWARAFQDDRLEPLDFRAPTDLAAISIETFTARRGYQIAGEYRKRGIPVVMGGYHATFLPEEVKTHADAVCIGDAEAVWGQILHDVQEGTLADCYDARGLAGPDPLYDRSIFRGKRYYKIALVEAGRGCCFNCSFCSITAFHRGAYKHRPVKDVVSEAAALKEKVIFLVDDNIIADLDYAKALFDGLRGLKIQWVGQASINAARETEILDMLQCSGCVGLLVGFESLEHEVLAGVHKQVNRPVDFGEAITAFRERGIVIYGTFMLGLPGDASDSAVRVASFARKHKMFMAAFNHLVPFPGTPLYETMEREGRLLYPKWWLHENYRFGDPPFRPYGTSSEELKDRCHKSRRAFYSFASIVHRGIDLKANCNSLTRAGMYLLLNSMLRREIKLKRGLPLGFQGGNHQVVPPLLSRFGYGPKRGAQPEKPQQVQSSRVELSLATEADNDDVLSMMAQMPMPGMVKVAYRREPSFFAALRAEGTESQTIIGRDARTGCIAGMGTRSLKPAYVNGSQTTIGYLSSLRVSEQYRKSVHLVRGYDMLRKLHADGHASLYLSTILDDNKTAMRLTRHRTRLPAYHDIGQFRVMGISLSQKPVNSSLDASAIRAATGHDIEEMIEFFKAEGGRRQFFPAYRAEDFFNGKGMLPGLKPEDVLIARRGGRLEGVIAVWDQKAIRRNVVAGYSKWVSSVRPFWNAWSRMYGLPSLPSKGSVLNCVYLSLVCVRNDDKEVFSGLLREVFQRRKTQGEFMLAGMHERDPLLPVLSTYRSLDLLSRIFVVCWEDGESRYSELDDRIPYLELGAL